MPNPKDHKYHIFFSVTKGMIHRTKVLQPTVKRSLHQGQSSENLRIF